MTLKDILFINPADVPVKVPKNQNKAVSFFKYTLEPFISYALYFIAIIIIVWGVVQTMVVGAKDAMDKTKTQEQIIADMRIALSENIALALTFILAAEVMNTFRVPNLFQLIKVALIVLLRELITYFLDAEVERLKKIV